MAEAPLRIPIVAQDAGALEALRDIREAIVDLREAMQQQSATQRQMTEAQKKAAEERKKAADEARQAAAEQKARDKEAAANAKAAANAAKAQAKAEIADRRRAAETAKEQAKQIAYLEKAYYSALTPSEKNAVLLANLHRLDLTAITDAKARAEAEKMRAAAIEQVTRKMEDQKRREDANQGRSLSMLFDEQNKLLAMLPGRIGQYAQAVASIKNAGTEAAEGLANMKASGEAGNATIAAMLGLWGGIAIAGAAAVGTVAELTREFYAQANEMDRVAFASGITAEQLSKYQTVAQRANFDLVELADIHGNIAQKMVTAAKEVGAERDLFEALGIAVVDANGKTREVGDVFLELTDIIGGMRNNTEALNVAQAFLGEDGAKKLLYALRQQPGAFRAAALEAEALNLVLNESQVEAARNAKFAADSLTLAWQSFKKELSSGGVGEVMQDIQLQMARLLSGGDALVIGTRRLADGTEEAVKVQKYAGESIFEYGERVRAAQKYLQDYNARQAEATAQAREATGAQKDLATTLREAEERRAKEAEAQKAAAAAAKAHAAELERMRGVLEVVARDSTPALVREMQAHEETLTQLSQAYRAGAISALEYANATATVEKQMLSLRVRMEAESQGRLKAFRDAELASVKSLTAAQLQDYSDFKDAKDDLSRTLHETEMARIEAERVARIDAIQQGITLAQQAAGAAIGLANLVAGENSKAARIAFYAQQAAALAGVAVNTALGVTSALAAPPPATMAQKAINAGIVIATGLASAATIASTTIKASRAPQTRHAGGPVIDTTGWEPGEVPVKARAGEVVVSAEQARAMGGPTRATQAVREMAAGGGGQGAYLVYDRLTIARAVEDDWLANGRTRRIMQEGQRYGLRPSGRR